VDPPRADLNRRAPGRAGVRPASRIGLLSSPVFVLAAAALLWNDRVLKGAFPGFVTGKLSDVAGVVVIAVAATVACGRPRLAMGVTAVAFAVLKTVPGAAALAAPLLGGVTRTDPGDVLAVVVLVPLVPWAARRLAQPPSPRGPSAVHAAVQLGAVVVAVTATTATSCVPADQVVGFRVAGPTVWARLDRSASLVEPEWARSDDRGRTWRAEPSGPPPEAAPSGPEACEPSGRCWRVEPGIRVLEREGDRTATAFAFTADERANLADARPDQGCLDGPDDFVSVAVLAGPTVVVAMGSNGVLVGDGATWTRIGVLDRRPVPIDTPRWLFRWTVVAPIVVAVAGFLVAVLHGLLPRRRRIRALVSGLSVTLAAIGLTVVAAGTTVLDPTAMRAVGPVLLGLSAVLVIASCAVVLWPLRPPPPLPAPKWLPPPTSAGSGLSPRTGPSDEA